jgi:hypothetical protein
VAQALSGPFLIAALTLCVAGVAKLRAPGPAAEALRSLRLPARPAMVRAFAAGELALGLVAAISPGAAIGAALAGLYAVFAALTLALQRRGAACGCFGEARAPASPAQSAISVTLAAICAIAAAADVHGAAWITGRTPAVAVALIVGIAGAVYGIAVAYSELPSAWGAWGGR